MRNGIHIRIAIEGYEAQSGLHSQGRRQTSILFMLCLDPLSFPAAPLLSFRVLHMAIRLVRLPRALYCSHYRLVRTKRCVISQLDRTLVE